MGDQNDNIERFEAVSMSVERGGFVGLTQRGVLMHRLHTCSTAWIITRHAIRCGSFTIIKGLFVAISRFIYGWSQRRRQRKSSTTVAQLKEHY
jgi:hypothetical protein